MDAKALSSRRAKRFPIDHGCGGLCFGMLFLVWILLFFMPGFT